MFTVNLKSLFYLDTFRLTKNVSCSLFRSSLRETTQTINVSRCFSSRLLANSRQNPVFLPARTNVVPQRQATTPPARKSPVPPSPFTMKRVIIVAVIGSAFLLYFNHMKTEKKKRVEAYRTREIGKAKLGGKFNLVDQDNKPVSSDDLLGQWLLIYFGFTHCPDICPDELEKMVEVVDSIEKTEGMKQVKPIFITVDPERDSPSVIKKYLKEFSDKILGLTGTVEQIASVCKAYRVYFSPGPKDSDSDYIVDHSIIMYLIDPDGKFLDFYGQNKDAKSIVSSIHFNQMKHEHVEKSLFRKAIDTFTKAG